MSEDQADDRVRQIAREHGFLRPDGTFIWTPPKDESPEREDPEPDLSDRR